VDGILAAWFGGEMGAKAIADVLLGEISPSGKLPVSFPKSEGHLPCYYSALPGGSPIYLEGERKALFPFGFGLSYTTFLYSGLCVEKGEGLYDHTVSFKVKNTGKMASDEIVQLYVNDVCSSVVTPELTLQGFKRVPLKPGEEKAVVFRLGFDNFKLLNKKMEWVVEPGEFQIMIGASSEEIRLTGTVTVKEGCREKKAPEGAAADR
ncbi:MAG: fibronectin type III-like domain-contianing protein, partial [Lachnospiraceae bacterium]|nr:fibronectin type III-like domain-contianing protein [Lachnospiraceae bacterium]